VKAFLAAPGRVRMLTVLFLMAVVALKSLGMAEVADAISVVGYVLPKDAPVSADEATAAVLGVVAIVKALIQYVKPKAA